MPKLERNEDGEYYTRCHTNETFFTVHFYSGIESYLTQNHINIGDELPHSWHSETARWQYTHGKNSPYSFLLNAKCPKCGKRVFYYENEYGSKVYFDHAGDGWPKHQCMNTNQVYSSNNILKEITVTRIIFKKGCSIIYSINNDKYISSSFTLKNKKSKCKFCILQNDNIPNKIIIFDSKKAKEVDIITSPNQNTDKDFDSKYDKKKQEIFIEVLVSAFRIEKDRISIDIKNNIDFYKIDIENNGTQLRKNYTYTIVMNNNEAKTLIVKSNNHEESFKIIKGYRRLLSRCTFQQEQKKKKK